MAPRSGSPVRHPEPPPDLDRRHLPLAERAGPWVRIFRSTHRDPLHFGRRPENRFDAPRGQFGVLYAADRLDGAFVEVFGRQPDLRILSVDSLAARSVAEISTSRALRLVDLRDEGLAATGSTGELTMGGRYPLARRWSLALWRHPDRPDGLWYRSRHVPSETSVAIFDRAHDVLTAHDHGSLLGPAYVLKVARLLDRFHFGLDGPTLPIL